MVEIDIGPNIIAGLFGASIIFSWHGFFSFVAVLIAVLLVGRWAHLSGRTDINADIVYSVAIWCIIGGIIGARIVHVIDHWESIYSQKPLLSFAIWQGGIGMWGGILGGFVGGAIYAAWNKYPVGAIADLAAPVMLFVQSIGRLGDIVNGEHCAKSLDSIFGFVWTHPDSLAKVFCNNGFSIPGGETFSAHPVIVYQIFWNLLALFVVWNLRHRIKPDGMLFAVYLSLYSVGRFAVSLFREDRIWMWGLQEAHFIALLILIICLPLLILKAKIVKPTLIPVKGLSILQYQTTTRAQRRRN